MSPAEVSIAAEALLAVALYAIVVSWAAVFAVLAWRAARRA